MPVLQDIPVAWSHTAECRVNGSQFVRGHASEAVDEFNHHFPIPFPPETRRVERARRRLNFPFWPSQTVDGKVTA